MPTGLMKVLGETSPLNILDDLYKYTYYSNTTLLYKQI